MGSHGPIVRFLLDADFIISCLHIAVPPSLPLSEPTTATFLILRKSSSRIIGRIVHHFQKLDEPAQYSDVEALQAELDHFTENLPPHFRMYEPDKSLDQSESSQIVPLEDH